MNKYMHFFITMLCLFYCNILLAQDPMPQMGGNFRPNYESYRLDKFIEESEASYSGELNFSIPLLTVPGRHGNNFDIKISYNSNIRQRQFASWVGLGWNLEIGAVERTVNGRADEPSHNSNYGNLGPGRGNKGGRFKPDYLNDLTEDRDVADQYHLLIDGGGIEIIPFNSNLNESDIVDFPFNIFLPVQYKPWKITASAGNDGAFNNFKVVKEDGATYNYGNPGPFEYLRVTDNGVLPPHQEYRFPYRWNLKSIQYPDGSSTIIDYEFQNSSNNRIYRPFENVMIDRSKSGLGDIVNNYFGTLPPCPSPPCSAIPPNEVIDWVEYEYAHPTKLTTNTHYVVFVTSSNISDSTARNCRLDELILYENNSHTELKRVIFHYAQNDNSSSTWYPPGGGNYPQWNTNQRLNHNQLTLIGFTIQNGGTIPPEGTQFNGNNFQDYYFTYTTNPKIDIESIARYAPQGGEEWPGYFKFSGLATAWRLKTLTLPTGGRYTFEHENVFVNYSPEGEENNTFGWNYSSEPMSRLKSKKFEDGFDSQRIWNYSYSEEVVYDPPGYISQGSYVPKIYRYNVFDPWNEYYKWFRGCTIGHRWVKINNPDGSWKKIYFTSSYQNTNFADPLESKPDYIAQSLPGFGGNIGTSYAGSRGVVWKEETGVESNIISTVLNYFSYLSQGQLRNRYDYYPLIGPNSGNRYVFSTSIWIRLDSTKVTRDGVSVVTTYQYNPTMREDTNGNGLVEKQINKGNKFDKQISYSYAYFKYPGMQNANMRSQLYSTTLSKGSDVNESKEFYTWNLFSNRWLTHKIFKWNGLPDDITAPEEPTGNNVINIKTFSYDNSGYSNVITETDANGFVTKYYYSNNINEPFINNTGGLQRGYLTGIEYPLTSPLLGESFRYDHYGNVIYNADENNNSIKADYDDLGRIISVMDHFDNEIEKFNYYLHNSNSVLSESNPNSIIAESYRSLNDFTTTKYFYCGAGFERQKLIAFGDDDLIAPTTYDNMWRLQKSYKPYQVNLGVNKHKYDVNYHNNATTIYSFSSPFTTKEYYTDGTGRIKNIYPPGDAWQISHYLQYSYDSEQGNLFKTLTIDENGITTLNHTDKFGNNMRTIVDQAGLDLITEFEYNALDQVIGIKPPNIESYSYFDTKTLNLIYPTNTGVISIDLPVDQGDRNVQVKFSSLSNCSGGLDEEGTVLYYHIKQFQSGNLISQSPQYSLYASHYGSSVSQLYEVNGNADNVQLYIEDIYYPCTDVDYSVRVDFKYSSIFSGFTQIYKYDKLGLQREKESVDAGTVKYLYDKAGNFRFTQDANQAPTDKFTYQKYDALNRLTEVGEYTASGNFTHENAGNVNFPLNSDPNKTIQKSFIYDIGGLPEQRNLLGNFSRSFAYYQGNIIQVSFFSYDENNRVEWLLHQYQSLADKKISYWYDWQGNVIKKSVSDLGSNTLYTFYEYDEASRLSKVFTNTIDSQTGRVQEAEYTYNADGTVKRFQLASSQGMDYLYNERSWLKQINHQNLVTSDDPGHDGPGGTGVPYVDKFGEVIGYNLLNHIAGGSGFTPQAHYNGNISWNIMRTKGVGLEGVNAGYPDPIIGYVYNYDGANRLTKADFGYYHSTSGWSNSLPKAAMYDLPLVSYDANGNILNLQRKGVDALMMDNFTYAYQSNKNRLASITNTASGSQTYNYGYDNNGNVTTDEFRDISGITYNISDLPEQLTTISSIVKYWYDNNGNRFRKQSATGGGSADEVYVLGVNGETEAVFDVNGMIKFFNILAGNETIGRFIPGAPTDLYLSNTTLSGNYEATNSITVESNVTVGGLTVLKAGNIINLKPGFTAGSGNNFTAKIETVLNTTKRFYYLKDHLGSIRVTVNEVGEIVSYDDYDPWGMILTGRSGNEGFANDKYKFTGKERDVETGYDYFGARYYDSRLGRWMQVDPLTEKYFGWSPYNYTLNNPLKFFDLNGEDVFIAISGFGQFSAGSEGASNTTASIMSEIQRYAKEQGIVDYDQKGYLSSLSGAELLGAVNFIKENLSEGEKLIIYGYSLGGANAIDFVNLLGNEGINVDLLITVDASRGFLGTAQSVISENVGMNINFYQETPDPTTKAVGAPNEPANKMKPNVENRKVTNTTHLELDEKVRDEVIKEIKRIMKED